MGSYETRATTFVVAHFHYSSDKTMPMTRVEKTTTVASEEMANDKTMTAGVATRTRKGGQGKRKWQGQGGAKCQRGGQGN